MTDFNVQCCFCGDRIETFCNAVTLTIALESGGPQELWAHITCLRAHLHQSVPLAAFDEEADRKQLDI